MFDGHMMIIGTNIILIFEILCNPQLVTLILSTTIIWQTSQIDILTTDVFHFIVVKFVIASNITIIIKSNIRTLCFSIFNEVFLASSLLLNLCN